MKAVTRYQCSDGSEWAKIGNAQDREALCERVKAAMLPLGEVPQGVLDGQGWLQHDLETVNQVKDRILDICREEKLHEHYKAFTHPGRDIHPVSIVGRILDDGGGPLSTAWNRFCRIDPQGREHQQPYYAYTSGPLPEHVCVESREVSHA